MNMSLLKTTSGGAHDHRQRVMYGCVERFLPNRLPPSWLHVARDFPLRACVASYGAADDRLRRYGDGRC